jgi:wyosine [tRNA(Phe)-imidazoG37] synthetase (radical SAM superfamily)
MALGVDNLRGRRCSYGCTYCEVGQGLVLERSRRRFYEPETVVEAVRIALEETDESVDHIAIVPAGEPSLDVHLGELIVGLKELGPRVAVFTNGSLMSRDDVRRELAEADWLSIKADAAEERTWRRLNRPFEGLEFDLVVQGMRVFAASFRGQLVTETMLVDGVNTSRTQLEDVADFVSIIKPRRAYLTGAYAPDVDVRKAKALLEKARGIFAERFGDVVVVEPEPTRASDRRVYLRRLARRAQLMAPATAVHSDAVG